MEMLTAISKTDQVVSILRNMIKKGKYAPNSRLPGIRELAKHFKVSTCVISRALETLQTENLVNRKHGRGVFINQLCADDMIEVYVLLWRVDKKLDAWLDELMKITYPPLLPSNFSFTTRTIVRNPNEEKHLDDELARINNLSSIKCLLVNASTVKKEHFKKFQNLHCPVIFIGDFLYKEPKDFLCNRISGDNIKYGMHCAELMIEQGCKEISLFTISLDVYFNEQFFQAVRDTTAKHGIKLNLYAFSGGVHMKDVDTSIAKYREIFEKAAMENKLDAPILLYGLRPELFPQIPILQKRLDSGVPIMLPSFDANLMTDFHQKIYNMIKAVINNPTKNRREYVDIAFKVEDLINNKTFLITK